MSFADIKRIISNIVQIGTISETKSKEGKALARVTLDNTADNKRVSKFLPVISLANSFARVWVPIRVGEQVLVISPFGNANSGFIFRSIFNKGCKEPVGANEHTTIMEFEDGTRLSYDSEASELKMDVKKAVTVICTDAYVKATNQAKVETPKLEVVSEDILFTANETVFDSKVTVKKGFIGQGSFALTNKNGDPSEVALFNMKIRSTEDIETEGAFLDSNGNLTTHTNEGYTRD